MFIVTLKAKEEHFELTLFPCHTGGENQGSGSEGNTELAADCVENTISQIWHIAVYRVCFKKRTCSIKKHRSDLTFAKLASTLQHGPICQYNSHQY